MKLRPFAVFLLALAVAATALAAPAAAAPAAGFPAAPLCVMSFNIRYGTAKDGDNAWPLRREFLFETIAAFGPDLIGFQEVVAEQHDALTARFADYGFAGVARDDGRRKGEWSCVAYRKARFDFVAGGDFWLSETPDVVGSKGWDAALPRLCTWVRLRERASGREFLFANTHYDHRGVQARRESSRLLAQRLAPLAAGAPAVLTGDFNLNEDDPGYATLVRPEAPGALRWIDSYRTLHPVRQPDEATFNGFKAGTEKGSRIDFVFHTEHLRATAAAIDRTARDGRYPSDHYPVTAVLVAK